MSSSLPAPPNAARRATWRLVLVLTTAAVALLAAVSAGAELGTGVGGIGDIVPGIVEADPAAVLESEPRTELAVGVVALGMPFEEVVAAFGPPARTGPDLSGTAHFWDIPGGTVRV